MMSSLKCKIVLKTWYQETSDVDHEEILPETFTSIDDALEWLSINYKKVLDWYPLTELKIVYE